MFPLVTTLMLSKKKWGVEMTEYIEREKARELIKNFFKGVIDDGKPFDPVDDGILLARAVDLIRPADVRPNAKGAWKWLTPAEAKQHAPLGIVSSAENWICSECKTYKTFGPKNRPNFCDKCGADMRGTK